MNNRIKSLIVIAFSLSMGLSSCKKNADAINAATDLRDSVYAYSKEVYLWSDNLPATNVFNPLSYPSADSIMRKVRTYSPFVNGRYQDRWSFVIDKTQWDNVVSGNSTDTGIRYAFNTESDLRVKLVYSQSSAGKLGITRGWKTLKINGIDANYTNIKQINDELGKLSQTILFQKPDHNQVTLTLTGSSYKSDYVMNSKVFNINGNNVGYFAFDSFLGSNSGQTTKDELDKVFADFKSKNVTELVLDLRYNGGGYGTISNYLGSLIAPASATGKVFVNSVHNSKYSKWNRTEYFTSLSNSLKLSRISIITTKGTASASEELINALKPVMTVKLIGSTTHGKPVGYYGFPTMNSYVFPVALKNVNSVGFADFYEGFAVDKAQTDDVTHDLGDPAESCLSIALNYIKTGVLQSIPSEQKAARMSAELLQTNESLNKENPKILLFDIPKQ